MTTNTAPRGLRRMVCFTLAAPDVEGLARAYCQWFDYTIDERSALSADIAQHWGVADLASSPCLLLRPPGDALTYVRLVQQALADPASVLLTHGWTAMEILVHDPYQLAADLAGSPFQVVVPPRPLPFDANIHAMQVIGPAGELLYMTSLPAHRQILDLSPARYRVDRPFIAILGGPDAARMLDYYEHSTATSTIAPAPVIVQIINDTFSLPANHAVPLGIVKLPRDNLIEVDELPSIARARRTEPGRIPPGIAMVSFSCGDLDELPIVWRAAPRVLTEAPYAGRRSGLAVGAAGEWLELIESAG
ncbi:MAG: hypothetical protein R3F58_14035 [Steroidobacteraceae bacterium]